MLAKLRRLGVEESVVGLVLPAGYSFNHDGTCLYWATVSVFLAQAVGIHLSIGQQLALLATMLFTSKGGAGVAGSAIVILATTLSATNVIPVASVGLILGVHSLLSSAFVPVNVLGNSLATIVMARMERAVDLPTLQSEAAKRPQEETSSSSVRALRFVAEIGADEMNDRKTAMVVSAHSADFVWRAGGAIALYAERGWRMVVVCLSFGERGESAKLWRLPGMTLEGVKADRKDEALRAAQVLGAEVIFFDLGDYPLRVPDEAIFKLAGLYRQMRPEFILTHSHKDPYNFDHPLATHVAQEARVIAQAHGHEPSVPDNRCARRYSSSNRISLSSANGSRNFFSISHLFGRRNSRRSKSWPHRSICGTTMNGWRCSAARRAPAIPIARK